MKKFVATDMSSDQVKQFTDDFYELHAMYQNSVTIVPQREKCIKKGITTTFEITVTPLNENIATFMEKHVFNEENSLLKGRSFFKVTDN